MPLSFPESAQLAQFVGRSPWTAADAFVGSLGFDEAHFVTEERVQGDPRRPGGPPHKRILIGKSACATSVCDPDQFLSSIDT